MASPSAALEVALSRTAALGEAAIKSLARTLIAQEDLDVL